MELRPVPDYHPKQCSHCGAVVAEIHDMGERRVRDLPILEAETSGTGTATRRSALPGRPARLGPLPRRGEVRA
jgi:hypothetical protein